MKLSLQDVLKIGGLLVAFASNYALMRADVARLAEKVEQVNPVVLEQRLGEIGAELRAMKVELQLLREDRRRGR